MTYGIMLDTTRAYVLQRATQSGVTPSRLGIAPLCELDAVPRFRVYVTFGGALDEIFDLYWTSYEVNIVDWVAEQCAYEAWSQGEEEGWEVDLHAVIAFVDDDACGEDDVTESIYKVSSLD